MTSSQDFSNLLPVADFILEVQKGNVPGHSIVHISGRNPAVSSGIFEFLGAGDTPVAHVEAFVGLRIKAGGNTDDDVGGLGAREVTIAGLDISLNEIEETLVLLGANASLTTDAVFFRPNRMFLPDLSCGTYGGSNVGDLVLEGALSGTELLRMLAGEGESQYAGYTIPKGKTGLWLGAHIMVDGKKAADVRFLQRRDCNVFLPPVSPIRVVKFWDGVEGHMPFMPASPEVFPALTDLWWEASGSGQSTEVSMDFEILLVDDDALGRFNKQLRV